MIKDLWIYILDEKDSASFKPSFFAILEMGSLNCSLLSIITLNTWFKRRTLHVPNLMQMRKLYCSPSFALDSADVKFDVWTGPKSSTLSMSSMQMLNVTTFSFWQNKQFAFIQ